MPAIWKSHGDNSWPLRWLFFEIEILQNIRYCFLKLLRLEGSEWLFISKDGFDDEHCGFDEELINLAAQREKILQDADLQSQHQDLRSGSVLISHDNASMPFTASVLRCGYGCVWGASLFISFGVWCINRILELSRMESRTELWGKYTYVLNRLQLKKQQQTNQEIRKRVLKLEFCLHDARSQTRKLQWIAERGEKAIRELREQLKQSKETSSSLAEKQSFWDSSGFKIIASMSMIVLVIFSKR